MSNPEVENLVRDSMDLMYQITNDDQSLEKVIKRSNAIRIKMDCMKEYQDAVDMFNNATANGKTREILLRDLQKETRLIQKFVENLELKEINDELLAGLSNIMHRHRFLMEQLSKSKNKTNSILQPQLWEGKQAEKDKKYKDHERNMFFYQQLTNCLNRCEENTISNAEIMVRLREENVGLRQLLNMHKINEPAVVNVYNKVRALFEERKTKEDEMQESIIERTIEIQPRDEKVSQETEEEKDSSSSDKDIDEDSTIQHQNNTIIRKPS